MARAGWPAHPNVVAQRLHNALTQPSSVPAHLPVSGSIGLAMSDGARCTPGELLCAADDALYRAKTAGKNTWRLAETASETAQTA